MKLDSAVPKLTASSSRQSVARDDDSAASACAAANRVTAGEAKPTSCPADLKAPSRCFAGEDANGAFWIVIPEKWNGSLVVHTHGGPSMKTVFDRLYRTPASKKSFWDPPSGHPGTPANLFATSTYERGGMALAALRLRVGTRPMLKILRRWATEHRYRTADIDQFRALAEQISGEKLGGLFQRWLYQPGKPPRE